MLKYVSSGLALLSLLATGCFGPPPGAPVATPSPTHGKITFADGSPLRGGIITFSPVEVETGGQLRYEGAALVDTKGDFKIGLNGDGQGVPAGEYKVAIKPRDYQELRGSNSGRIPRQYRDGSAPSLQVVVKEGDNKFDFVLK